MTSQEKELPPSHGPLDLNAVTSGLDAVQEKGEPDEYDILEVSNLEDEKLREEIHNLRSDRKLREKYADRILAFLETYAVFVFLLIVANAIFKDAFDIPENAIVTLVGSTAVAAIGLVGFVAKGLFK